MNTSASAARLTGLRIAALAPGVRSASPRRAPSTLGDLGHRVAPPAPR